VLISVPASPLGRLPVLPHLLLDICRNLLAVAGGARGQRDFLLDGVGFTAQRLAVV
jgi:hypothetical protein